MRAWIDGCVSRAMATASSTDRMRPKTLAWGLFAGGAVWAPGGVVGGGATGGVWACAGLLAATSAADPTAHSVRPDLMERLPGVQTCATLRTQRLGEG